MGQWINYGGGRGVNRPVLAPTELSVAMRGGTSSAQLSPTLEEESEKEERSRGRGEGGES